MSGPPFPNMDELLQRLLDGQIAPDEMKRLETAILEGGAHDRSINLALEACEFFEIPEAEAREIIRTTAQRVSDGWREAFRQVGVSGALARDYEAAFVGAEMEKARSLSHI